MGRQDAVSYPVAGILHTGPWKRVFGRFPEYLSRLTGLPVTETDDRLDFAYLAGWDPVRAPSCPTYVPYESILLVHDKRRQARAFLEGGVAVPETHLLDSVETLAAFQERRRDKEWVLKWPVGCSGTGHQMLNSGVRITPFWQPPFLVQEFIRLERPEVYRLFAADGETFGWVVRRSPPGETASPWVSYSGGAEVEFLEAPPEKVLSEVLKALKATGLHDSFGAVDLMQSPEGQWLVLEVNTDGIYNYVGREVPVPELRELLDHHVARSFRKHLYERSHPA
jgi:glutathione synthase/RimK-type ligase-like ATP-grasp enzyme